MPGRELEAELRVGVSFYTSALCYSVIRLEPYTTCALACSYCYARWYRPEGRPEAKMWLVKPLERLWSGLSARGLRLVPFRLSTLSDPLQPLEEGAKLTLAFLRMALRHRVPVVLNTKRVLFACHPWSEAITDLASRGLLVLQISLSTLDEEVARVLEPRAPPPAERLEKAGELSGEVPLVVRLQPLVPGLFEREREELVEAIAQAGARQVVVEFLRETPEGLQAIYGRLAQLDPALGGAPCAWESYSLAGGRLRRPSLPYRREILAWLRERLARHGITLGTCKEGIFELQDGRDCCGFRFLDSEKVAYRLTLYDIWRAGGSLEQALEEAARAGDVLYGPRLAPYPRPIRRALRAHENKLLRALERPYVLTRVCSSFYERLYPSFKHLIFT